MSKFYVCMEFDTYDNNSGYWVSNANCIEWDTDKFGIWNGPKYNTKEECEALSVCVGSKNNPPAPDLTNLCINDIVNVDLIEKTDEYLLLDINTTSKDANNKEIYTYYIDYTLFDENYNKLSRNYKAEIYYQKNKDNIKLFSLNTSSTSYTMSDGTKVTLTYRGDVQDEFGITCGSNNNPIYGCDIYNGCIKSEITDLSIPNDSLLVGGQNFPYCCKFIFDKPVNDIVLCLRGFGIIPILTSAYETVSVITDEGFPDLIPLASCSSVSIQDNTINGTADYSYPSGMTGQMLCVVKNKYPYKELIINGTGKYSDGSQSQQMFMHTGTDINLGEPIKRLYKINFNYQKIVCDDIIDAPICAVSLRLREGCAGSGSNSHHIDYVCDDNIPEIPKILFDLNRIEQIEPWATYTRAAAQAWNNFLIINPHIVNSIKEIRPDWNGIYMDSLNIYNDPADNAIARCGPVEAVDIIDNDPNNIKYNSISYSLYINTYYLNHPIFKFNAIDWIKIITHELGHALGIGIYWDMALLEPNNFWLDGHKCINASYAYNNIIGDIANNRKYIPIEDDNLAGGSAGAHFEPNSRTSTNYQTPDGYDYPGLAAYNDIMITYYGGPQFHITDLDIDVLVDIGYQRKSSAAIFTPPPPILPSNNLVSNITIDNSVSLKCESPKEILSVGVFNIDTKKFTHYE